jgi:hypothetical protein
VQVIVLQAEVHQPEAEALASPCEGAEDGAAGGPLAQVAEAADYPQSHVHRRAAR